MSEQKIPMWLRKPSHKKEVVATEKGWVVKETGEVLTRVPGLPQKIAEYFGHGLDVLSAPLVVEELPLVEATNFELTTTEEQTPIEPITEEPEPKLDVVEELKNVEETTTEEVKEEQAPDEEINKEEAQPKRRGRPAKAK